MTTIAYCLKRMQVATDSRATEEEVIISDTTVKWHCKGGVEFFMCGTVSDEEPLMRAFLSRRRRISKVIDADALAWDGETLWDLSAEKGVLHWHPVMAERGAIGSGNEYALAALDAGMTPRRAVAAACKRDTQSGGKVVTYKLERR
jgi:hypothetical protein